MLKLFYFMFPYLKNKKIRNMILIVLIAAGLFAVIAGLLHIFTPLELVMNSSTGEPSDTKGTVEFIIGFIFWTALWSVVYYIHKRNE